MGIILTYGFLVMAICFNWISEKIDRKKIVAFSFFIISIFCGIIYKYINIYGVIIILLLFISAYFYYFSSSIKKNLSLILLIILSLLLATHIIPGFNNYNVVKNIYITSDSTKYSLYFNFDKASAGFIILFFQYELIKSFKELKNSINRVLLYIVLCITVVTGLSVIFGYVKYEPKIPSFIVSFLISNLFFTCVAEELFFRKIIQENINNFIKKIIVYNKGRVDSTKNKKLLQYIKKDEQLFQIIQDKLPIIISAVLFASIHIAGGLRYFILAFTAGLFYSIIYEKTKKVEMSILAHFLLNIVHIIFFTYPALI